MRIKILALLLVLAALPGLFLAHGSRVTPYPPYPSSPPCALSTVGIYLWMGSYPSGWTDFTCTAGYTGDLTITVMLVPYSSSSSWLVSPLPLAQVTESWPKYYANPNCTYWGRVRTCPIGEPAYLVENAPSSGRVSADAYAPGGVCFKTQVLLEWYDSQTLTGGSEFAESGWVGSCY